MTRIVNFVMELGFSLMGLVPGNEELKSDGVPGTKRCVSLGFKMGERNICDHPIVYLIG